MSLYIFSQKLKVVFQDPSTYGAFYSGDSYICLYVSNAICLPATPWRTTANIFCTFTDEASGEPPGVGYPFLARKKHLSGKLSMSAVKKEPMSRNAQDKR